MSFPKNKSRTKKSVVLLVLSIFLVFITCVFASPILFDSFKYQPHLFIVTISICWVINGGSIVFALGIADRYLKRTLITLNFVFSYVFLSTIFHFSLNF